MAAPKSRRRPREVVQRTTDTVSEVKLPFWRGIWPEIEQRMEEFDRACQAKAMQGSMHPAEYDQIDIEYLAARDELRGAIRRYAAGCISEIPQVEG